MAQCFCQMCVPDMQSEPVNKPVEKVASLVIRVTCSPIPDRPLNAARQSVRPVKRAGVQLGQVGRSGR